MFEALPNEYVLDALGIRLPVTVPVIPKLLVCKLLDTFT